jgi:transcription initiation factor IIE alpha subunit
VNTCAVDILIPILLKTLNEHFEVPVGGHCTNEDCEESWNEIHLDGDTCPQCGSVLEKGPVES